MPLTSPIKPLHSQCLSGYKAGLSRGGIFVQRLEDEWAGRFGVKHAIACNSATSGLLAACVVCGPDWPNEGIAVPCFTMSATAAAPIIARPESRLYFMDCDSETYCSTPAQCMRGNLSLIVVTNLFGQAAPLTQWREFANKNGALMVEDAAQAPFAATPDGKLAGTVGDVGVYSFNVHKHLQCGEGGMIVTDNDQLAEWMRGYINHGECRGQIFPGLNLRMPELCACIILDQFRRANELIGSRIALAHELSDMVRDFWVPPVEEGKHVFYIWAVRVPNRDKVVAFLNKEGIPVRAGYVDPLYRLEAFKEWASPCPVAEKAHDKDLMIFEICSWNPNTQQLKEMKEIFLRASEYCTMKECHAS